MGEAGLISRVLTKKFGGFLTFASLRDESATAPGQVTIHDMKQLYRWDAIGPATKVYGVVASPVMHSMSPAIHNAGFDAVGHEGVYLPMLVNPRYESFKAFIESFLAFEPLDLAGLSITLPHKENALRYLKEKGAEVEPLAEQIGAVNTIIIARSARGLRLNGINTDYAAILDSITNKLNITRQEELPHRGHRRRRDRPNRRRRPRVARSDRRHLQPDERSRRCAGERIRWPERQGGFSPAGETL
jgi:3-dehydroquinate dehydratase/shikimate dehydrogenase